MQVLVFCAILSHVLNGRVDGFDDELGAYSTWLVEM